MGIDLLTAALPQGRSVQETKKPLTLIKYSTTFLPLLVLENMETEGNFAYASSCLTSWEEREKKYDLLTCY